MIVFLIFCTSFYGPSHGPVCGAPLGGDCLGNSGRRFESTIKAFYYLADLCDQVLASIKEGR